MRVKSRVGLCRVLLRLDHTIPSRPPSEVMAKSCEGQDQPGKAQEGHGQCGQRQGQAVGTAGAEARDGGIVQALQGHGGALPEVIGFVNGLVSQKKGSME